MLLWNSIVLDRRHIEDLAHVSPLFSIVEVVDRDLVGNLVVEVDVVVAGKRVLSKDFGINYLLYRIYRSVIVWCGTGVVGSIVTLIVTNQISFRPSS